MDSNGFNLERKINEFLENFNQNANSALDDGDVLYGDGLIRSRSKYMMDDELEMSGRMTLWLHDIDSEQQLHCSRFR